MSTRKAISTLPENDHKYEKFLEGLTLVNVGMKACSAFLDRDSFYELFSEKKGGPTRAFKDTYKITKLGNNFFEAVGHFVVTVTEELNGKPTLSVECEFEAHIHGPAPIPKPFAERFVKSEFQLILVPYARQLVASLTAQMSVPPLILPLSTRFSKDSGDKNVPKGRIGKRR
jgi:Preprotein translocase subunit SecB